MINLTASIMATYGLLAASVLALWLPPIRLSDRAVIAPWAVLLALACAAGVATGLAAWVGIFSLAAFAVLAYLAKACQYRFLRVVLLLVTGWMTLALSMHKFGGFANPSIVTDMLISHGTTPFTHHLNFDTTAAGIILFAAFCSPARTLESWRDVWKQYPIILGTPAVVLLLGLALRYVNFDFKIVAYTPVFLCCNLLFTCVTEEAFFRGFMQHQLALAMQRWRYGPQAAMVIAAVLFGIAHAKGGPMLVGLAALAGLGYGFAYLRSKRIEASILTHFTLNAIHFVAFTYPQLN